jgi:predicted outer membrane repeat protein
MGPPFCQRHYIDSDYGGSIKSCDSGFFGGVYVKDGNAVITGCSFFYNTAVTFGAAIYFYSCAQAKVISCRIQDNVSGAVTGIYSYDSL